MPPRNNHWLSQPLAIVGMACRLPGADDLDSFWELLSTGGYAIERMPDSKLNRARYLDPRKGQRGKTYSDIGGFVRERDWDWSVLPVDPRDVGNWDECHLNLCEVAAQACLHAGYDPRELPIRNTSVFVGHSGGSTLGGELALRTLAQDYVELLEALPTWSEIAQPEAVKQEFLDRLQAGRPTRAGGRPLVDASYASGLISRAMGLTGPHASIDAACASSLVALALGANSLHSGQADMAIIGGASYNKTDSLILFSHAQSCSATASKPFDSKADGLVSSEGYVTLVIKTVARAEADGDTIQAVIRGIGMSSDGRGRSLWAPRHEGQSEAIRRAYAGDVRPESVQMIEAHATSTQVGDATEMQALAGFYGQHLPSGTSLPVGSVKSNIGHTLESAGLAGLVKSVLSIQNATIPPSVNVTQPSETIPWADIPLHVPQECEPWPKLPDSVPRRAAVNAFGIGGLNVHVVVDEYLQRSNEDYETGLPIGPPRVLASGWDDVKVSSEALPRSKRVLSPNREFEPIAVVGRGLIVPGAQSVDAFAKLMEHPASLLRYSPEDRMRGKDSKQVKCGYIADFEYDWRRHKVPPKQIAQANPLQFMLLDAAEQALNEAGVLSHASIRVRTAVVVGSPFGGDFGNALFAGLRLPEFREHLESILVAHDVAPEYASRLFEEYEKLFLKTYPALLDETGSFTSSTLASRLSKTYDLQGGAMAIDAGDASSAAVLSASCGLLHSGAVSHVLCAAAQRALDRSAIENLSQLGRLPGTADESNGDEGNGYPVGEGVALLVLKRQSDAIRDGDTVLATIHDVCAGFDGQSLDESMRVAASRSTYHHSGSERVVGSLGIPSLDNAAKRGVRTAGDASTTELPWAPSSNILCTGHLQAAQGLVDVIAVSLNHESTEPTLIASHTPGGLSYLVTATAGQGISAEPNRHASDQDEAPLSSPNVQASGTHTGRHDPVTSSAVKPTLARSTEEEIFRFSASSKEELAALLGEPSQRPAQFAVPWNDGWRAAIVCTAPQLSSQGATLAKQLGNVRAAGPLAEQGMYWSPPTDQENSPKVAWIFPGQGSQTTGMLRGLVQSEPVAAACLHEANSALVGMGQPTFDEIAWREENLLGENVWHTQAAMLIGDWIVCRTLLSRGLTPSLVAGHSFGEFPAMLAAGCWSLQDALQATWNRCQAIVNHVPSGSAMLSVQTDSATTQKLIDASHLQLTISHLNAPQQTVVGGEQAKVTRLAQLLDQHDIAYRVLPVPTAFHTPSLTPATAPFYESLQDTPIEPPRIPLLSSISNKYEADPQAIKRSLAAQLVTQVDFVGLVERMVGDGVTLAIEIGPGQVLSRLVRQTTDRIAVVASDHPRRGAIAQLLCVQAAYEVCTGDTVVENESIPFSTSSVFTTPIPIEAEPAQAARQRQVASVIGQPASAGGLAPTPLPIHFDATSARRTRMRSAATERVKPANNRNTEKAESTRPVHFDATDDRDVVARAPAIPLSVAAAADRDAFNQQPQESVVQVPGGPAAIDKFLIDFVVEQTGYPAEIIELDWDIEADLGIDSIKKAQLFGELREFFDLEQHASLSLDSFRTLRDIVDLLEETPVKKEWEETDSIPEASATGSTSGHNVAIEAASEQAANQPPETHDDRASELTRVLVDFVVEQTGYPPEIVELDADLEADLGIDSIKKAQLLGELREMFDLSMPSMNEPDKVGTGAASGLTEFSTLRHILDVLLTTLPPTQSEDNCIVAPPVGAGQPVDQETLSLPVGLVVRKSSPQWLPIATILQEGTMQGCELFHAAIEHNLKAMAARYREQDMRCAEKPANGQSNWYRRHSTQLANSFGCTEKSICALDRTLQIQSSWRMAPACRDSNTGHSFRPLIEMRLPDWFTQSGGLPVGLLRVEDGNRWDERIVVPGTVVPLVSIRDGRRLIAGGVSSPGPTSGSSLLALSRFIQTIGDSTVDAVCARARELEIHEDWWLLVVDTRAEQRATIRNINGSPIVEKTTLSEIAPAPHDPGEATATIGINAETGQLEILAQQQLPPFSAVRYQLGTSSSLSNERAGSEAPRLASAVQNERVAERESQSETASSITSRYVLRMAPAPARGVSGLQPTWSGAAMVVGDNPIARQLESRLRSVGVKTTCLPGSSDPRALAKQFEILSCENPIPHLFITTPWDDDAKISLDEQCWKTRRNKGLLGNFWLCQKWLAHVVELDLVDDASLVAVTSLGGDFGVGNNIQSAEGGGLAGLLKSMVIESWTQGIRPLPVKIIDCNATQSPAEIVGNVWQELAVPSYDFEVSYRDDMRQVVRAIRAPLSQESTGSQNASDDRRPISQGGTWICTGGARGITAHVAGELALKYGLKLHLLGTAPKPDVQPDWHALDDTGLRALKLKTMTEARAAGQNPVKTWQDTEKAIEIDATLTRFAQAGIQAYYHSCDVSDRAALKTVLRQVRSTSGPIHGVLHGAGVGKDSRFDRKQDDKVQQCIGAKVDGALALIDATWDDPLECFVGFGSISGRFGANGHTDYSLANEMLCKQIDWLAKERPDVRAIGFHWHAWGDVGMATKPETRLALEMIDMQFMPAAEGVQHLLRELESGAGETEILITDDRYYRMFFPAETLVGTKPKERLNGDLKRPVLTPLVSQQTAPRCGGDQAFSFLVDPVRDPFLTDHLLDGRPLLPFVVASEMLLEAASRHLQSQQIELHDIEALGAVRFFHDAKQTLRIETTGQDGTRVTCNLYSDFIARDGRLVDENRLNFRATGRIVPKTIAGSTTIEGKHNRQWQPVRYPAVDDKFYVGWPLQRLRKVMLVDGGIVGRISAPALIELAGNDRQVAGWRIPCAAMDACLFTMGILAWQQVAPGSALPVRIGSLSIGRLPDPGEACEVHARLVSARNGRASFDFTLYGVDREPILDAMGYEVAWLNSGGSLDQLTNAKSVGPVR